MPTKRETEVLQAALDGMHMQVSYDQGNTNNKGGINPPVYAGDAGFDLVVCTTTRCIPGLIANVPIGIRVALPEGVYGMIMGRSSTNRSNLLVLPSIIDQGYRGPLFVMVRNLASDPVMVPEGIRIAQLIPLPVLADRIRIMPIDGELPDSDRGNKGFGSSGRDIPRTELLEISDKIDHLALARRALQVSDGHTALYHLELWHKDHSPSCHEPESPVD